MRKMVGLFFLNGTQFHHYVLSFYAACTCNKLTTCTFAAYSKKYRNKYNRHNFFSKGQATTQVLNTTNERLSLLVLTVASYGTVRAKGAEFASICCLLTLCAEGEGPNYTIHSES